MQIEITENEAITIRAAFDWAKAAIRADPAWTDSNDRQFGGMMTFWENIDEFQEKMEKAAG